MGTKSDGMLPGSLGIRTDGNSTFSGSRGLGQGRIVLFHAAFCHFPFHAEADGQGSGAGGFRIFPDGHGNSLLGIVGLCILAQGDRIFIHCLTTQAR